VCPTISAQGFVPVISGAVGWNEIVFYGEMFKSQRIIAFVAVDLRPFTGAAPLSSDPFRPQKPSHITSVTEGLCALTATEAVARLRAGEVTAAELVEASIARIEEVDPKVNALPIPCFDRARDMARDMARKLRPEDHADNPKSLCGLPIAVKDYNDVGGVRTTYGSPIFAQSVAAQSDATVRQLERNGAIPMAKSNVPEWAGGNTFNPVFGATRNPWDLRMSVGGSSGGSAAALASGLVWLATGNDLGGQSAHTGGVQWCCGAASGSGPGAARHPPASDGYAVGRGANGALR
jgi:hypothetical protein